MVLLLQNGFTMSVADSYGLTKISAGEYIYPGCNMTAEELDFCKRIQEYKHRTGEAMPPCTFLLEAVEGMGYSRTPSLTPRELSQLIAKETYRARCVRKKRGYFLACSEILAIIIGQGYEKVKEASVPVNA